MKHNPIKWVPSLYFAMGLPFVTLAMVSVLVFSDLGVSNTQIAFWTSLIMLPWTLKPLWSAFLEMFKTKKYFVIATELITGVAFGLVAMSLPLPSFFPYAIALMAVIALSGATHDIAADGVYMSELDKKQQSQYIGWQGAFYNMAKVLATGGLVFLAGMIKVKIGPLGAWVIIMSMCAAIMITLAIYNLFMIPQKSQTVSSVTSFKDANQELWMVIKSFFQKKYIWLYISFIILYRFAEGFTIKIVPLFLKAPIEQGGLGMSVQDIGLVYGIFGAAAFIIGSICSGYFISAYGLKKTIFSLCCIFNIPFAVYFILSIYQPTSLWIIGSAIVFEYFGYGFGFVGLTLFMMQQIAPGKFQMSHYAFASGIMNLGVMIPGMMSGWMSDSLGYQLFFSIALLFAIPAFIITWFLPFTHADVAK